MADSSPGQIANFMLKVNYMRYLFTFLLLTGVLMLQAQLPNELLTKPETTNYTETSTYADVMRFIKAVSQGSPNISQFSMGTSLEGKEIPVLVLAEPKVSTPEEAKASGKPVIYIQGNIHSGEVEGKEILQILLREILHGDKQHLMQNQIIMFAPIYNTDSNDKLKAGRRPSQEGSPKEVGIRANSQGWDLNRDGIKMEALETQGLFKNVILPWDPTLFVDLHTTNGTWHGYSLTWAPSYHYAGEKAPYDYTWDKILPDVTQKVKENYNVHLGPYGYFFVRQMGWPVKSISTYNHHPRYLVNQFGLRNRMAILSEAFAHERLYQRMNSTYAFVTEILEHTHKHGKEMMAINAKAEADAIAFVKEQGGTARKGVRFEKAPLQKPIEKYRAYEYMAYKDEKGQDQYLRKPNIVELDGVENYSAFKATKTAIVPKGYIIPAEMEAIVEHLKAHGAIVTKLDRAIKAKGERYVATKLNKGRRQFEKHYMATIEGAFEESTQKFKAGEAYIVDLAQPLANLIFYMLEPESDDGLVNWNFFDEYFREQKLDKKKVAYPIFKYFELK